ncbi:MAG: GxxExxY protein [Terrimicrobiaceae bacterium]
MFTTEDTEDTEFLNKGITEAIIASAICVHKSLGPGLLDPQVITCLKLTGIKTGLLINFNVPLLKDGLERISL